MMLNMMLHQMATLLMAGILGTSPVAAPRPMVACPTSLTVSATINNGTIVPSAKLDNGTSCSSWPCSLPGGSANSVLSVSYDNNNKQFIYKDAKSNQLLPAATSVTAGGSALEFSIVGANNNQAIVLDPSITVTVGTCTSP